MQPPVLPHYLLAVYSSRLEANDLYRLIKETLSELDFEWKESSEWKITWRYYVKHDRADGEVEIYQQGDHYIPYFRFHDGSSVAYYDAIRELWGLLKNKGVEQIPRNWVKRDTKPLSDAPSIPLPAPPISLPAPPISLPAPPVLSHILPVYRELTKEELYESSRCAVANMKHMMDKQRVVGSQLMADYTLKPHTRQALLDSDTIEMMVSLLEDANEDVHRCASSAIANLLQSDLFEEVCPKILSYNGHIKLQELRERTTNRKVKQETTRALEVL